MFGRKTQLKEYDTSAEALSTLNYAKVTTSKGVLWLDLYTQDAPNTVANFAHLANSGFYNNLKFHRVIAGFMAQGGCPNSHPTGNPRMAGTGGPDWAIKCETAGNKPHRRGTLSMAHAGKNTGGSQFFICFVPCPHLNGVHTVFGGINEEDVDSLMMLDSIAQNDEIVSIEVVATKE